MNKVNEVWRKVPKTKAGLVLLAGLTAGCTSPENPADAAMRICTDSCSTIPEEQCQILSGYIRNQLSTNGYTEGLPSYEISGADGKSNITIMPDNDSMVLQSGTENTKKTLYMSDEYNFNNSGCDLQFIGKHSSFEKMVRGMIGDITEK